VQRQLFSVSAPSLFVHYAAFAQISLFFFVYSPLVEFAMQLLSSFVVSNP
jgi:hypothetical protein